MLSDWVLTNIQEEHRSKGRITWLKRFEGLFARLTKIVEEILNDSSRALPRNVTKMIDRSHDSLPDFSRRYCL